jgi:hypothetical protein
MYLDSRLRPRSVPKRGGAKRFNWPQTNQPSSELTTKRSEKSGGANQEWPLGDSNPDAFRHKILNLACLPISPSGQTLCIGSAILPSLIAARHSSDDSRCRPYFLGCQISESARAKGLHCRSAEFRRRKSSTVDCLLGRRAASQH